MSHRRNTYLPAAIPPLLIAAAVAGCGSVPTADPSSPATATMHADYPVYESEREVSEAADTVVRGIVKSSVSDFVPLVPDMEGDDPLSNPQAGLSKREKAALLAKGHGYVATTHTVEITEVIRGDVAVGDTVTVSQLGGLQDGTQYVVDGVEQMSVGGDYVLVTTDGPGDTLSLINLDQGIYTVGPDDALTTLAEDPSGYVASSLAEAEEAFAE